MLRSEHASKGYDWRYIDMWARSAIYVCTYLWVYVYVPKNIFRVYDGCGRGKGCAYFGMLTERAIKPSAKKSGT